MTKDCWQDWEKHLIVGKLYRHIDPDVRGWNEIPGPPMLFVGFSLQQRLKFLDENAVVRHYYKRAQHKPEDQWERVS